MKNKEKSKNSHIVLIIILMFICGTAIGWFITYAVLNDHPHFSDAMESCDSDLKFIRQSVNCEFNDRKRDILDKLDNDIEKKVGQYLSNKDITRVGVFVRDQKSTHFAGINENESFYGASLLKLPLIISKYKQAEVQPELLDKAINYDGSVMLTEIQSVPVKDKLTLGKTYTVRDLINRSIIYSDNTSAQILYETLPVGYFDSILNAIGIKYQLSDGSEEILVTPRTYANLFRILYNTSYLTSEYSNEILSILTKVDYKEGAMKNIPSSEIVAHKFAERSIEDPTTRKVRFRQLHECGLVFMNDNKDTYSFCIMSEGKNFSDLEKIQQELSLIIYTTMKADIKK